MQIKKEVEICLFCYCIFFLIAKGYFLSVRSNKLDFLIFQYNLIS